MSRIAEAPERAGRLVRPFECFQGHRLEIDTPCMINGEDEDTYNVKFPGIIGYSGQYRIQRCYVKEVITDGS